MILLFFLLPFLQSPIYIVHALNQWSCGRKHSFLLLSPKSSVNLLNISTFYHHHQGSKTTSFPALFSLAGVTNNGHFQMNYLGAYNKIAELSSLKPPTVLMCSRQNLSNNWSFYRLTFLRNSPSNMGLMVHLTTAKKKFKRPALIYKPSLKIQFLLQMVLQNILIAPWVPSVIVFEVLGTVCWSSIYTYIRSFC